MQFILSRYVIRNRGSRNSLEELKKYRLCGVILLSMMPVFAAILILIVHKNSCAGYPGFLIYIAAIYAFCKTGTAVSNLIKFKRHENPILSAAKTLSLITALISMLSLETAILSRYGSLQDPVVYRAMLGTFGGGVCVFVLYIAIRMIVQATKDMKTVDERHQGGAVFDKSTPCGGVGDVSHLFLGAVQQTGQLSSVACCLIEHDNKLGVEQHGKNTDTER